MLSRQLKHLKPKQNITQFKRPLSKCLTSKINFETHLLLHFQCELCLWFLKQGTTGTIRPQFGPLSISIIRCTARIHSSVPALIPALVALVALVPALVAVLQTILTGEDELNVMCNVGCGVKQCYWHHPWLDMVYIYIYIIYIYIPYKNGDDWGMVQMALFYPGFRNSTMRPIGCHGASRRFGALGFGAGALESMESKSPNGPRAQGRPKGAVRQRLK